MKNKMEMTYDKAMARLEALVKELDSAEAVSMADYKQKAAEAKELITFCRAQLTNLEQDMQALLPE